MLLHYLAKIECANVQFYTTLFNANVCKMVCLQYMSIRDANFCFTCLHCSFFWSSSENMAVKELGLLRLIHICQIYCKHNTCSRAHFYGPQCIYSVLIVYSIQYCIFYLHQMILLCIFVRNIDSRAVNCTGSWSKV